MSGGKTIIFVVDGDLAVRESLKFSLELEGLIVRLCATGAELLRDVDLSLARCVVLDAHTPFTDAFKTVAVLSTLRPTLPVILLTSHSTEALQRRAVAARVCFVLEKPILDNSLLSRIQDVLAESWPGTPPPR